MNDLKIEYRDPKSLAPSPLNPRTHSKAQVRKIASSIDSFGFNNPVLLDGDGKIIAGHGRVLAAIELGMLSVPTVPLAHLSEQQKIAYVIADNRIAELAGWDNDLLKINFGTLLEMDLGFEITSTGFEMPEIDGFMIGSVDEANEAEENIPLQADVPSITRRGDLWALGDHLIFCGDALDPLSYDILLGRERAQMVFTDHPYNVPIVGHVSGLGKHRHREFAMASGEMTADEFVAFLRQSIREMVRVSVDGALHFLCMDWRHLPELFAATDGLYSEFKNLCVWVKPNGGMGSLYRSRHELVLVMKAGQGRHINNIELGRHGRNRTNVWEYGGISSFGKNRDDILAMHPTVKPVAMVRDAIYDCSTRGGIILDPFGGSGTTLVAAHQAGRRSRIIEIDPRYVDVSLHRFMKETGIAPVNVWTGLVYGTQSSRAFADTPQGKS